MRCVQPYRAYYSFELTANGKRSIVPRRVYREDTPISLPCGSCVACRLERSRQHAIRCVHEAQMHLSSLFITLTYDDENLPWASSLYGRDVTLFLKRLRRRFHGQKIRYLLCGEYGERNGRPHYHVLLFGCDFSDKVVSGLRRGLPVWHSDSLESIWENGRCEIGSLTFESAAYVARYVMKKQVDVEALDEMREPEFVRMSLKPGLGIPWLEKFHGEVYPLDRVVLRDVEMKPPRAYDIWCERKFPEMFERVRKARVAARVAELHRLSAVGAMSDKDAAIWGVHPDATDLRLSVQEEVLLAKVNRFAREV